MVADRQALLEALDHISPELPHDEWVKVGMALQHEGFGLDVFDRWSARDARPGQYSRAACERAWKSFGEREDEVTGGTIVKMAQDAGWRRSRSFGYNDRRPLRDEPGRAQTAPAPIAVSTVSAADVGTDELPEGEPANAGAEIKAYLAALFAPDEHVGFVTNDAEQGEDGKWRPGGSGRFDLTRDQIVERIGKARKDLSKAFGTAKPEAGAWVRINPLDGKGVADANITAYRHALVESDSMEPGRQLAMIRAMRLPVSAIVTSGGKSVHAVVRVDASTKEEYRERVKALYDYCRQSGFPVDEQNRNPSRLSRLPGFARGDGWQRLVQAGPGDGFATWDEWQDWVAEEASGLPDIESVSAVGELPSLAPQLIHGVLRDGQKGMLVGPSKAGKSFALIELAIAVTRGWEWMGHTCARGKVLYVNLEIQRPSFYRRLADVYRAMKHANGESVSMTDAALLSELRDLDVWCLRGHSTSMDRLQPMLVRRAASRGYRLVIIDPIYKVLTGDENSASDMAYFCNQFDVIAESLSCAVFYAHHHAKGEAGRRGAIDRASGSGVFARDPDAMLDMSPLRVPAELQGECAYAVTDENGVEHERHAPAYRVSYTLREFETPPPKDVLFRFPLHVRTDALRGCNVVGAMDAESRERDLERGRRMKKEADDARRAERNAAVQAAIDALAGEGAKATCKNVEKWLGKFRPNQKLSARQLSELSKDSKRDERGFPYRKVLDADGEYVLVPVTG